jgi:hypothetical protein
MDKPANLDALAELGELSAKSIQPDHFPSAFDLLIPR